MFQQTLLHMASHIPFQWDYINLHSTVYRERFMGHPVALFAFILKVLVREKKAATQLGVIVGKNVQHILKSDPTFLYVTHPFNCDIFFLQNEPNFLNCDPVFFFQSDPIFFKF